MPNKLRCSSKKMNEIEAWSGPCFDAQKFFCFYDHAFHSHLICFCDFEKKGRQTN